MCLWRGKKGHQNQKLFLLMKNIRQSLTQRCTESLSTSAVLNCKVLRSTLFERADSLRTSEGGARVVRWFSLTAVNPSLHAITEDTNCWCCFLFFWQSCIEEYHRRVAFPVKVGHFQCRQFPHAGSCVIFALHISLVSYLNKECPSITLEKKVLVTV